MSPIRYRKNIDCLSEEELHELREALSGLYALPAADPNSFLRQAGFHGGPPTSYCRHGAPGFFTWHRAYLRSFEDALSSLGCHVSVPFWDWSSGPTTGVPEACREPTYVNRAGATVANPLHSGPRPAGGWTERRADIDTTPYDDLATTAQTAMSASTFSSFQSQINGVHGSVHVRTGGDMSSVPTAAFDPIFFLHHATVDRLWSRWQALHPGPLPPDEASFALVPFNRPFTTQWQVGSDVESTDFLGYRYRSFCFFLPWRLWEAVEVRFPLSIRKRVSSARLVVQAATMPRESVEFRVFLNQPRATARTKIADNPAFAGAIAFIGHGADTAGFDTDALHCLECARLSHHNDHDNHASTTSSAGHASHATPDERLEIELDITRALREVDQDSEDVTFKILTLDAGGDQIPAEDVALESLELVVD